MGKPSDPPTSARPSGEASGFPLTALFLLTAFASVMAAILFQIVHPILAGEVGMENVVISSVSGALIGMILGAVLGLAQRQPLVGMFVGGPTGFVLGAVLGPLVLVPSDRLSGMFATTVGGSVILVLFAVGIRMFSRLKQDSNDASTE